MFLIGKGPAQRLAILFGDEHGAELLCTAMLDVTPMVDGEAGIAAAVGLKARLVILQTNDERQDRRFVLRQPFFADINGQAP